MLPTNTARSPTDGGFLGNYHETNHLCPDGKGGYFLAIGTASHNGPVFEHTKGEYRSSAAVAGISPL